jgi:hypothetical protein
MVPALEVGSVVVAAGAVAALALRGRVRLSGPRTSGGVAEIEGAAA